MFKYSKTKLIVACAVIVLVLIFPAFMAFNEQQGMRNEIQYPTDDIIEVVEESGFEIPIETTTSLPYKQIERNMTIVTTTVAPTEPKWIPENQITDGKPLATNLIEEDSINILIMGLDREAFLNDTIGVASISKEKKTVKIIMFPRDTYIGYSDEVLASVKKIGHSKLPGEYKINNSYNIGKNISKVSDTVYNQNKFKEKGFDFVSQVVYEKFDIRIDDYIRINTFGFVKLVNMFGGVKVYVPVRMLYSDPEQGLEINLSKGTQVLNGSQAEGFVRFRQGTTSSGATVYADRTKNQVAFLKAFFEQHAKISNVNKIPELFSLLKKNIVHSIGVGDILTEYMDIFKEVVNENYTFESIEFETDDKKRINGSIYLVILGVKDS